MPDHINLPNHTFRGFIRTPIKDIPPIATLNEKLNIFIPLFLFEIILAIGYGIIITGLEHKFGITTLRNHKVLNFLYDAPVWIAVIAGVAISPLVEELIFRLHLRLNEKYMHLNFIIIISTLLLIIVPAVEDHYIQISIITLGATLLLLYFIRKTKINQFILSIWNNHYPYVFYFTALCFGMVHITNFKPALIVYLLMPILVLPQLLLGLFCGYIRLRLGFNWGFTFHALHNSILILPILITSSLPGSNNNSIKIVEQKSINESNSWRITKDTIEFDRLKISNIIPKLFDVKSELFEFTDPEIANKILTINFARGTRQPSGKKWSSGFFVLTELLRKFDLKMEQISIDRELYQLIIIDSTKLSLFNQYKKDSVTTGKVPVFYNNEIILHNANLDLIARTIALNFDKNVFGVSLINNKYTITIPKLEFDELNQFIEDQYGIKLNKSVFKVPGYKISAAH